MAFRYDSPLFKNGLIYFLTLNCELLNGGHFSVKFGGSFPNAKMIKIVFFGKNYSNSTTLSSHSELSDDLIFPKISEFVKNIIS